MPRQGKDGLAQSHKLTYLSEHLSKQTHFTSEECKTLLFFHRRMEDLGPLERTRFREILCLVFGITDDVMLDLVFRCFDRDNDGFIDDIEWVRGLSVMLRGTMDQLIEFTYMVYDMNGDGSLAREELYHCLKGCIYSGFGLDDDEIEDCERDIVEIAMKKLDTDRDGQITYEDFIKAVKAEPLILQACGSCLPSSNYAAAFQSLFTDKYRKSSALFPGIRLTRRKKRLSSISSSRASRVGSRGSLAEVSQFQNAPRRKTVVENPRVKSMSLSVVNKGPGTGLRAFGPAVSRSVQMG